MSSSESELQKAPGSGDRVEGPAERPESSNLAESVKSANDWEHADLGDEARKGKFLKLMGAAKEDHKGKIVIGEENTPKHKGDPKKMDQKLEEQFDRGLEHKLKSGYKGHLGLGFQAEEKPTTGNPDTAVEATPDTDKKDETNKELDDVKKDSPSKESHAEKRKSTAADSTTSNNGSSSEVPKKKSMMMNFVKASDS